MRCPVDPLANPAFIIFSAIAPMLIALIKQSGFSRQANALVALGAYVVVGIAGVFFSGEELTAENAVALIAVATTVGTVSYGLVWNNLGSGEESVETKLNVATSIVKPSADGAPTPPTP